MTGDHWLSDEAPIPERATQVLAEWADQVVEAARELRDFPRRRDDTAAGSQWILSLLGDDG